MATPVVVKEAMEVEGEVCEECPEVMVDQEVEVLEVASAEHPLTRDGFSRPLPH